MINIVQVVILFLISLVGSIGIITSLLWLLYFLTGKLLKQLGYWELYYKTLVKTAEEIRKESK